VFVHQRAEDRRLSIFERDPAAIAQLLHIVQVLQHVIVALLRPGILIFQDCARAAGETGEEKQQVVFEIEHRVHAERQRLRDDLVLAREGEARDASICGDVLILLPDGLSQPVDLDMARQLGELTRMNQTLAVRIQRFKQCGRETARRAEPGTGGDIRQRGDFDLRRFEIHQPHRFPDDRMLDLFRVAHFFELCIFQVDARNEWAHDGYVHIAIDRCRDEKSFMLAVVGR